MSPESSYLIIAGAALWALIALTALAGVAAIYTRMEARILQARREARTGPLESSPETPEAPQPDEEPRPEEDWEEGWRIAAARLRRERGEEDTREEPEEPSEGLPADST